MRCADVQEHLSTYDYGGLSRWRRWQIGRHLARCAECAHELAALRRTAEVLSAVPDRPVPARLWERVWAGVETENARRRQAAKAKQPRLAGGWARAGAALAAAVLIAFGLVWSWGPAPPRGPDVFENPAPFVRYHHLLGQQVALADAAGLDILATTEQGQEGSWEEET